MHGKEVIHLKVFLLCTASLKKTITSTNSARAQVAQNGWANTDKLLANCCSTFVQNKKCPPFLHSQFNENDNLY